MVCDAGCADVVVSFETTEALRNQAQLKEGGSLIVNDVAIKPLPVLTGRARMPRNARADLGSIGAQLVPAERLALEAGSLKTANVVLLGALSAHLDFPVDAWEHAISARVPEKTIDMNLSAFRAGRDHVAK